MRKIIVSLAILGLALMAVPSILAAEVLVNLTTDGTGDRFAPQDVNASGSYDGAVIINRPNNAGFKIHWDISFNDAEKVYEYSYVISGADGGDLTSPLKNFYLQVSPGFSIIDAGGLTPTGGQVGDVTPGEVPLHALYWNDLDAPILSVSFDALAAPVWGSFFADDGSKFNPDGSTFAYNGAFPNFMPIGEEEDISDYVPVPGAVPVPPTVLLLGSGLLGLVGFRVRRQLI